MMKKMLTLSACGFLLFVYTGMAETVTNVRGSQRENSKLVDIYYDLNDTDGGTYTVEVAVEGRTNEVTATTFSGDVGEGIAPGVNRHVVWDAGADWRGKKGDVKAVVTATRNVSCGKVQLWEGGPYWADRNIGADKPEEFGLYFWWGDTKGHSSSGTTFGFSFVSSNCPTSGKSTDTLRNEGWVTSAGVLAPSHDAAHVKWGGSWRMPTYQELGDLNNKCDWNWKPLNGVNGWVVSGRGAYSSKSIFLPASGYGYGTSLYHTGSDGDYWSSVPSSDYYGAYELYFYSSSHSTVYNFRSRGLSVRPVQGFTN